MCHEGAPLVLVGDDPRGRREVGGRRAVLEMDGEVRVVLEVVDPGPRATAGDAADVDPAGDVVEHDLDTARLVGAAAGGRDVDGVAAVEGGADGGIHGPP
jgi:hypothetical protein